MERLKRHIQSKKSRQSSSEDAPNTYVSLQSSPQTQTAVASSSNAPQPPSPAIDATSPQSSDANRRKKSKTFFPGGDTLGLRILHAPDKAVVDVIFLHGLDGHPFDSWTHATGIFWPVELLKDDIPDARIMAFGYDANATKLLYIAGKNTIRDHARSFFGDLSNVRDKDGTKGRKIILVAHSLGGLLAKRAICMSQKAAPVEQQLDHNIFAIAFLGTPHLGSDHAKYATLLTRAAKIVGMRTNPVISSLLMRDSEILAEIDQDFAIWLRLHEPRLNITCFFEEKGLPVVGKVVDTRSAILLGHVNYSIPANHMEMAKFKSHEDIGYQRVSGQLQKWVQEIQTEQSVRRPEPSNDPSEEEQQNCLHSLAYLEMNHREQKIEEPAPGTCDWCFRTPTYNKWATSGGLLWVKGKAGSGKSTLMRRIAREIEVDPAFSGCLRASFFFHGRGSEMQKSPLGLYRSILHQICDQVPALRSKVTREYLHKMAVMGKIETKWNWTAAELQKMLADYLEQNPLTQRLCILLDALDEAGEESAKQLVNYFQRLIAGVSDKSQIFLCFACRHYPIITWATELELVLEANNENDISQYVKQQLSMSKARCLCDEVVRKARGTFLWVRIATDQILRNIHQETLEEIQNGLRDLPEQLDDIYLRNLEGLSSRERVRCLCLLQWVCFATRPLSLSELRVALVLDITRQERTFNDLQNADDFFETDAYMETAVVGRSAGLAEVVKSPGEHGIGRRIVQLIHQSTKDFLIEKGLDLLGDWENGRAIGTSNVYLSQACISYFRYDDTYHPYLTESGNSGPSESSRIPIAAEAPLSIAFHSYATSYWLLHAIRAEQSGMDQQGLAQLLHNSDGSHAFQRWRETWMAFRNEAAEQYPPLCKDLARMWPRYDHGRFRDTFQFPTDFFNLAAAFGLSSTLKAGLDTMGSDISYKKSLAYSAAHSGNESIVKLVIKADGVDLGYKDQDGLAAIHISARRGEEKMVSILVHVGGVDVNSPDSRGRTSLHIAVENKRVAVVRYLLENSGTNPNLVDSVGNTPLHQAVRGEFADRRVIQMLLEKSDVDPNIQDCIGQTPLHKAAANVSQEPITLLLRHERISLNLTDNFDQTPLHVAAEMLNSRTLRLLFDANGIDINVRDKNGDTPLHISIESRHRVAMPMHDWLESILTISERTPASLNIVGRCGKTPLQLLRNEGDVKILQHAVLGGYLESVKALLEGESDTSVSRPDPQGYTLLHLAAKGGHLETARFLIGAKANIEAKAIGRTPLHFAARWGHLEIAKVLVEAGGNIMAEDKCGRTPSYIAASEKHFNVEAWLREQEKTLNDAQK